MSIPNGAVGPVPENANEGEYFTHTSLIML